MNQEPDLIEFDDDDAIQFIINHLSAENREKVAEDDIQYVLDLICEFYEKNNLIENEEVEEATIAEDEMFNYIFATMQKEKEVDLTEDALREILDGEYEYGKSIGIYEEE